MLTQTMTEKFFRETEKAHFDFSQAPSLITRAPGAGEAGGLLRSADMSRWRRTQEGFLERTKDKQKYTDEDMQRARSEYGAFFKERGLLAGNVLDVGGGWGLYRQWWEAGDSDVFIVHDPGVERFLRGAYDSHYKHFPRAFSVPMTFVEGFGEELPYRNDVFDLCLVAAALDHCADVDQVLAEAYRCLRVGGLILILQSCRSANGGKGRPISLKRWLGRLRQPRRLLRHLYNRLFGPPDHLHHFDVAGLVSSLQRVGFSDVRPSSRPVRKQVYAFEATKGRAL